MARREVLNDPVRLGERAPDILICAAARPPKLTARPLNWAGMCACSRSKADYMLRDSVARASAWTKLGGDRPLVKRARWRSAPVPSWSSRRSSLVII